MTHAEEGKCILYRIQLDSSRENEVSIGYLYVVPHATTITHVQTNDTDRVNMNGSRHSVNQALGMSVCHPHKSVTAASDVP